MSMCRCPFVGSVRVAFESFSNCSTHRHYKAFGWAVLLICLPLHSTKTVALYRHSQFSPQTSALALALKTPLGVICVQYIGFYGEYI